MNNTQDMKRMLEVMGASNSLGDPSVINEGVPGPTQENAPGADPQVETNIRGEQTTTTTTVAPIQESVDFSEASAELQELYEELEEWIDRTQRLVRQIGGVAQDRAEMYWLAHIKSSLDSDRYGYGRSHTDMASLIRGLENDND